MNRVLAILAVMALCAPAWGITGKVVDNKGKPVAKARVNIWIFWMTDRTYRADGKGEFIHSKLVFMDGTVHPSKYRIVDAAGKPVPKAIVTLPWGGPVEPTTLFTNQKGEFTYQPPGDSKGVIRVLNSAGKPVPRAKAIFTWSVGKDETVMDDKGEYYEGITTFPRDKSELMADVVADGYTYASTYFSPDPEKRPVIRVWPDRVVKTRVVDEKGAPLQGVKVARSNATAEMKSGVGYVSYILEPIPGGIITRKDGSFELHHLPGADVAKSAFVSLEMDAPGRAKIKRTYQLAELRKSGKIVLPREAILRGTLLVPNGKTIPDDTLLLMSLTEDSYSVWPPNHSVKLGKDGMFRFSKLPPGKATIEFWTSHKRTMGWTMPAVQNLRIVPGRVTNLELTGTIGAVISGTVRDEATGNPIPSTVLSVKHAGNPNGEPIWADTEGKYSVRVAPGKVTVYLGFTFVIVKGRVHSNKDLPVMSLEAVDGQDKAGVDLSVVPPVEKGNGG